MDRNLGFPKKFCFAKISLNVKEAKKEGFLVQIEGFKWIRFLYSYPETITDELIKVIKENDKICKYFDIPLQHISDPVLKRMNRKSNEESIRKLISKIRKEIPDVGCHIDINEKKYDK